MLDKFGVLHSDFPEMELPNSNVWQYCYPRIKKWGDLTAFLMSNTEDSLTYNNFIGKSLCWAKELKKNFMSLKSPVVSFTMSDNIDCFPLIFGCHAVGAPICPLRTNFNKDLYKMLLLDAKPDVLVMDPTAYEKFKEVISQSGISPQIYIRGNSLSGMKNFENVLNSEDMLEVSEAGQYDPSSVALMLYSSGTTGTPKCSLLSHNSVVKAVFLSTQKEVLPNCSPDVAGNQKAFIGSMPLALLGGIQFFTLGLSTVGCKVIFMDCENIQDILVNIAKYKPVIMKVRNNVLQDLSNLEDVEQLSSLRTILFTGCPTNVEAFKKLNRKLGGKLFYMDCYGSTEANVISMMPVNNCSPGMSGKLIVKVQAKFVDMNTGGIINEPCKPGEIYCKGPLTMDGYLNKSEATKNVLDSNGWYRTGDIGYFDKDHFIKIVDRTIDVLTIYMLGEERKVYPTQIENIIRQHSDIVDVGVIGIPDSESGEEVPKAFVICKNNLSEQDIVKYVEERAPEEMRLIGGVAFVTDLPRDPLGKLIRKYLKDKSWDG